jgi:hypothetical protein
LAANTHDVGDIVRLKAMFTSTGGTPADPTTVRFTVESPAGTVTTYSSTASTLTNSAVGTWSYDLTIPDSTASYGVWEYRAFGEGTIVSAEESWFRVLPKRVSA